MNSVAAVPALQFGPDTLIRNEEFEALTRSDSPVTILGGQSGSGKSYLLEHVAREPTSGWSSIGEARRSDSPGFVLQTQLGGALAAGLEEEGDVARLDSRLRAMLEMATALPGEALRIGVGRILAGITAGVAPDIMASVERMKERLRAEMPEGLAERIEQASGISALDTFLVLAADVRAFGDGVPLTICVDRGERLSVDAVDLLRDFAEEPPRGIRILVAVRSDDPDGEEVLARLDRSAAHLSRVEASPLTARRLVEAVPGLPTPAAEELVERHHGRVLPIVDDLREATVRRRPLTPGSVDFAHALDRLGPLAAQAAERLAVFPERPSEKAVSRMLDLGPAAVRAVEVELRNLGLLESDPEGDAWFHELRRAALLDRLGDECPRLAWRALLALEDDLASSDRMLAAAIELAALAGPALEGEARSMWEVDADGLGLVAAHLELSTPGQIALRLSNVGRYAREQWATRDVGAGVGALVEAELMSEKESSAGIPQLARTEWSAVATALARGRLLREHGRAPVPYLANMLVSHGLADVLGKTAHRARIGPASIAELADLESTLREGRKKAATLMVRGDFRGVPLGIAARFPSEAERDLGIDALSGTVRSVFGKWLVLGEARSGPIGAQPARRWSLAAELLEIDLDTARPDRDGDADLAERLRLLARLGGAMSPTEREAAALDDPIAIGRVIANGLTLEVELRGGRSGPVEIGALGARLQEDPLGSLVAADELVVREGERLGRSRVGVGDGYSPLRAAIERIEDQISEFNKTQPPREIDVGERSLSALLELSAARIEGDVALLARIVDDGDTGPLPHCDIHLVVSADRESVREADMDAYLVWARGEPDEPIVGRLHVLASDAFTALDVQALSSLLSVPDERIAMIGFSNLPTAVARLTGYDSTDIALAPTR